MNRNRFAQLLRDRVIFLDGGYGTEFFKMGYGDVPGVVLNLKAPEVVESLHRQYVEAGADIILTNTFSGNRPKLAALGYADQFVQINGKAVELARRASAGKAMVFGNISSTGMFPLSMGEMDFEDSFMSFKEQAGVLLDNGVDGFIIETMTDIKELKAAILAIRSLSGDIPIIAQMSFDNSLRTITGTSVQIFATTLEDLAVDAIGINCMLNPEEMIPIVKEITRYSTKPISIEPNAGQPEYDGSRLSYNLEPELFARCAEKFVEMGVSVIGGCCGTTPTHIKVMTDKINKSGRQKPVIKARKFPQALTSRTMYRTLEPFTVIGERINPASRQEFQQQIVAKNYQTILKEAVNQEKEGAVVLDVNLGDENLLTREHFRDVVLELDKSSVLPVSFDIQNPGFLEIALREYPGRPLINSAVVTEKSLEKAVYLMKTYGGMLILLAMGSQLPETAEGRYAKIMEGLTILEANGICRERVLADPLVLSLGAGNDPEVTLKTIELLSNAGIKTTMGLSNLSYGLPGRSQINGAFLAQAVNRGLKTAIMNPGDSFVMGCLKGALIIRGDRLVEEEKVYSGNLIVELLLDGDLERLRELVEGELVRLTPFEVSQDILGLALEEIGSLYSQGKIYLPHLIKASDTAQPIFDYLNSLTLEERTYCGKVVLATVEGDVHDIGKKIVDTVLRSGGFQVQDIGNDVSVNEILQVVKKEKPDILGLSAMMTTTIGRIGEIIQALRKENIQIKVMAGGASMSSTLASRFGCEYAENASAALQLCKRLVGR